MHTPDGLELTVLTVRFGTDMTFQFASARIVSISFEDDERKADKLELTVWNHDLSHFDDPVWKAGNLIRFRYGYVDALSPEREAIIQKTTGFTMLKVAALAKSILLNTTVRSRTWDNVTRSQVVTEIASTYGYADEYVHIDDTVEVYETVTQARLTDAQFVRRLAHREGFVFYIDQTGFHFHVRRVEQAPAREFIWRVDQGAGDVVNIDTDEDVFAKPKRHRARGRNSNARTDIDADANDASHADRHVTGQVATLTMVDGESGSERDVERGGAHGVNDTGPTTEGTQEGATRRARARFRGAQQGAIKLKLDIIGDPNVAAKTVIMLNGIGRRLSGRYYVQSCKTTVDSSGFKQSLQIRSDGHAGYGGARGTRDQQTHARVNEQEVAAGVQTEIVERVEPEFGTSREETRAVPGTGPIRRSRYVAPAGSSGERE